MCAAPYTSTDNVIATNTTKEDILDLITNITPKDRPITAGLKTKRTAYATKHEWVVDVLAARGSLATVEGADAAYGDEVAPTRAYNYIEQIERPISISDVMLSTKNVGMSSQAAYTMAKASAEWANGLEYDVIQGTRTAYVEATTAAVMGGVEEYVASNVTAAGTVPLDEALFNNLASDVFDDGGHPTEVFCKGNLKRQISSWSVNTRNIQAEDKRLARSVDVYIGDFETVKVMISRDVTSGSLLLLDPKLWGIAYLINPHKEARAKTGSAENSVIIGNCCLESLNEVGNGELTGISTTGV